MDINYEIAEIAKSLKGSDPEFFKRVWGDDLNKYSRRIEAIGFNRLEKVLDAGFGMGQWLVKLSDKNSNVVGIEYSFDRVEAVKKIIDLMQLKNVFVEQGSVENLPYSENYFDAVFCYGVLFCTDYRKSLSEFYRVLKPGGRLYFTGNDLGWFLYCLIEQHNKSNNYDPRQMAADTLQNSLKYYMGFNHESGQQIIINREMISKELIEMGFEEILIKSEGGINISNSDQAESFYQISDYLGHGFIFEVLASKRF